ncbi:MAG: type II toxin-antitoxin system prevent-host-death family antitoxin [Candidatus Marinimicrobia bacterium CG08_land_8_20_14_0_20_45_22]|nr:MAG: type II toxin-antitoxin system prevent-host-death family antitoxin [Candidatus Marinimicrobia bacterium CG08_land_8_20_14_0_20_45_22]
MKGTWQIQDAKNKFSEVIGEALKNGPQIVTKHGAATAVIISVQDYKNLQQKRSRITEFFQSSPLVGVNLEIERMTDNSRSTEL